MLLNAAKLCPEDLQAHAPDIRGLSQPLLRLQELSLFCLSASTANQLQGGSASLFLKTMQIILFPLAATLFYAATAFSPQIGIITAVFSPLLMLLYLYNAKRSKYTDLIVVLMAAGLSFLSPVLSFFYIASVMLPAALIMKRLQKGMIDPWFTAAVAPLVTFAAAFIAIYAFPTYRAELVDVAHKAIMTFIDTVKQANSPIAQEPYFNAVVKRSKEAALSVVLIFPAINYIFTAFSSHVALSLFAKINKFAMPKFRLPDNMVWILIGGAAMLFINQKYVEHIGLSFLIMMLALYAFQGFDIVVYWMIRLKFLPIIRALIFVFIFSEPPFILFISLLGLFSVWFNMYGKPDNDSGQEQAS